MRTFLAAAGVMMVMGMVSLGGCAKSGPGAAANGEVAGADEHAHDDEGPHGGHIIELGGEEHHAELTHDHDAQRVGVHLLGADAKTAAPIEAESVTINVSVDGTPEQYVLTAAPQSGESGGKSSYFELVSEPLEVIVSGESEAKNVQARLSLTIEGKPHVGLIETAAHEHDHDHGHEH